MSTTHLDLKDIGQVKLFRRKGLKNIRISINSAGEVRLSVPWYIPKNAGIKYLYSKKDWIKKHKREVTKEWVEGQVLAQDYILKLHTHEAGKVKTITDENKFHIYIPINFDHEKKQRFIDKHVKKFLLAEAEKQFIPWMSNLSDRTGYKYKNIKVKSMKSRWGSCNHEKTITLNVSLLRLTDELVEYVMVHELVHTRHLNHGKTFWECVEAVLPDYKQRRKALKSHNSAGIL